MSGFKVCRNKGFHMEFSNGWTISVQFGGGNYCDNYDFPAGKEREQEVTASPNAEVAYWGPNREMEKFENGDTVAGRWSPEQVLALMNDISQRPA